MATLSRQRMILEDNYYKFKCEFKLWGFMMLLVNP